MITAGSMRAFHLSERRSGRSRVRGCKPRYQFLPCVVPHCHANSAAAYLAAFYFRDGAPGRLGKKAQATRTISQIRSGPPPASVGNLSATVQLRTLHLAGPTALLPEMVGRKFFASSHEPGSQTARDSTDGHPRGPFVGSDPPWLFLSHALKHRSGNVPDQRNVFTFAEIQDGRRT